jgi:hypothetical protein
MKIFGNQNHKGEGVCQASAPISGFFKRKKKLQKVNISNTNTKN